MLRKRYRTLTRPCLGHTKALPKRSPFSDDFLEKNNDLGVGTIEGV